MLTSRCFQAFLPKSPNKLVIDNGCVVILVIFTYKVRKLIYFSCHADVPAVRDPDPMVTYSHSTQQLQFAHKAT